MATLNLRSTSTLEFVFEGYLDEESNLEDPAVESALFYVDQETGILYIRVPGVDDEEDTWVAQGQLQNTYSSNPEDVGTADPGTDGALSARGDHVHGHGSQGTLASAHSAAGIDIVDSGALITATEVEGALQENRQATEDHIADTDQAHDASAIDMLRIGTPTYYTVEDMQTIVHSCGWVSGGTISADANGIDVTAGEGLIRSSASRTAPVYWHTWDAVADQTGPSAGNTKFVGVEYNSGSPQVAISDTYSWDFYTSYPLGSVTYDGNDWHVQNAPLEIGDHAALMVRQMIETMTWARDKFNGGLVISDLGGNDIALSAGALWYGLTRRAFSAVDTSAAGTFDTYYHVSGAWTEVDDLTAWPNAQYDDGTDLANLIGAQYANLWWYMDTTEDRLKLVYGTSAYATVALAEAEDPPSLPASLQVNGRLLGRFIFQNGATSASEVNSVWDTQFSVSGVSAHGDLSGVTSDQHHAQSHAHDGVDGSGTVAHSDLTGIGTDDHHTKYTDAEAQTAAAVPIATHAAITDAHHSRYTDAEAVSATAAEYEAAGSIATHASNADAHHAQTHAASHSDGGADEVTVENLATASSDTSQVLKPDGAGGLAFGSAPAGTGASTVESETSWGITPAVGTDSEYARQDHTHGTPADPDVAGAIVTHAADVDAHHARYTDAEAVSATAAEYEAAGAIATHAAITDAHHAKYTDAEAVTATAGSYEAAGAIATHASDVDAHHAKYTDAEAVTAIEAAADLDLDAGGGLVLPTGEIITDPGSTAASIVVPVDGSGHVSAEPHLVKGDLTSNKRLAFTDSAKDADEVDIADSGAYYTGTEVETALQEVGATLDDHETRITATEVAANQTVYDTVGSSGSWSKTTPLSNGLKYIMVECVAGGGAGGGTGATGSNEGASAGGGGAGGYSRAFYSAAELDADASTNFTCTVGDGGAGASNSNGGDGDDSSFSGTDITALVASGGGGGERDTGGSGRAVYAPGGSTAGSGPPDALLLQGDPGSPGNRVSMTGVSAATGVPTGNGGPSLMGGGGRLNTSTGAGYGGNVYGGGGAGACVHHSSSARAGGSGAKGCVIVTEFY